MSTDVSDSRGSHCSNPPPVTKKKFKKPPFNLYFARSQAVGRSDFHTSSLDAKFVTPKFYSCDPAIIDKSVNMTGDVGDKARIGDGEKKSQSCLTLPKLSSQSYGWWYSSRSNSNDPRINFHKNTSDMVRSNIMIQWENKKLRGTYH